MHDRAQADVAAGVLRRATGNEPSVTAGEGRMSVDVAHEVADGARSLIRIATDLTDAGVALDDIAMRQPTLDEVFINLTRDRAGDRPAGSRTPVEV